MRTIEDAPEPKWVDLPLGGRVLCRIPTWEDHDRAINRAADAKKGGQDATDVTRELLRDVLLDVEGFQRPGENGNPVPAKLPDDTDSIVRHTLKILDIREIESEILYRVSQAGADLGN